MRLRREGGPQVWVTGGEKDLMDAILTKGPMTVNVDASAVPFKFYKSGVYQNPDCQTGAAAQQPLPRAWAFKLTQAHQFRVV